MMAVMCFGATMIVDAWTLSATEVNQS